jgi:hypothetical protein
MAHARGTSRRLKFKSSIILIRAIFAVRKKIPKLCGFSAIQTWLTFTDDLDHI